MKQINNNINDSLHPLIRSNPELLKNLFITAVEYGSNHWSRFDYSATDVLIYDIFHPNWSIIVEEMVEDGPKLIFRPKKITLSDLNKGFVLLVNDTHSTATTRLGNILIDNFDAEDADVFLQFAVLGDVIYC